ncbi:LCP family protein [Turicibacter bilis]|uniref:LCP family protein n=1 Tax=Turicibacter bilis TaxID=2735723 RepID=UPI001BAF90AA|nr:LCP family protein [Turicibacter bilis]MBS3203901.1 LCP family protein [Turicibacter bilis]UUF11132.1 LCP family protein [Turicibacter bilis]
MKKWMIGGVITLALIGIFVGSGFLALSHYYFKLNTTDALTVEEVGVSDEVAKKEQESNIVNIAVLGIDRDGDGSNGRSDAIKVISLDMNNKKVKLTSFQRDTLIYIPDPENDFDKLNHAYWYGKAPLTLKTLNYNFDLDITRYVAFNFDAIEHIIDTIDGIELDVHENELKVTNDYIKGLNSASSNDVDAPYLTKGGLQKLSGRQAMAYMRNRYVGDDFDRMNRQNKVMEAMIDKVMNQSYTELLGLLDACLPYVETNLTMNEMINFGTKVLTFDLKNIEQTQIPASDNKNKTVSYKGYSPLYVMNSYQHLVRDVHAFIYNDTQYQPSQTVIETEAIIYETFGRVE